jgi:hypothetical protein
MPIFYQPPSPNVNAIPLSVVLETGNDTDGHNINVTYADAVSFQSDFPLSLIANPAASETGNVLMPPAPGTLARIEDFPDLSATLQSVLNNDNVAYNKDLVIYDANIVTTGSINMGDTGNLNINTGNINVLIGDLTLSNGSASITGPYLRVIGNCQVYQGPLTVSANNDGSNGAYIRADNLTTDQDFQFPNATGTLALEPVDSGWTTLSLTTGWGRSAPGFEPSYRKIGNIVYTRGGLSKNSSSATNPVATLPADCRPAVTITVYTIAVITGGTWVNCYVSIDASTGNINVASPTALGAGTIFNQFFLPPFIAE